MNQIQYKVIKFEGGKYLSDWGTIQSLNKIGNDGWILVGIPDVKVYSNMEGMWEGLFYRSNGKVDVLS